jgi:UDP-N-acetylmuramate dehydrogenase
MLTGSATAQQWFVENKEKFSGQLSFDEPLSKHTYYRIGGPARIFAVPKTREDLQLLSEGIRVTQVPVFVLGLGSNILVSDHGFDGLVIRASRLNLEIQLVEAPSLSDTLRIRTGGSVAISTFLRRAATEGWGGLEMLTGIPGSVGGVVAMNAGTHLGEAKDVLRRVEAVSLDKSATGNELLVFGPESLKFEYRRNLFLPRHAGVWAAEGEVRRAEPAQVKAAVDETLARRKATQPIDYPSCGSVFKNPRAHGMNAWQVIDRLGLRGHRMGGAQFSEKHSNFIVNLGGARAADVKTLIELARSRALEELGIALEEEVMYLGA